ncbi:hypothetical protein MTR_7g059235 [Medicago truncatula]|uniref:Uncharacterized protein n=1 Tax=Medicago truncatula TaxID=3880 RepID=A0A072TZA2_MEDTR|nr:hypothetical protein MTR_7g059235 [Medicago truncatula]
MCLSNENWSLFHLVSNIKSTVDNFNVSFPYISNVASSDRLIKWNNNNLTSVILNVDDIKELIDQSYVTVYHTLRDGNQCANFMAKFGASSDSKITIHPSPPKGLLNLVRADEVGIFFPKV